MSGQLGVGIFQGHALGTLKDLNDGFILVDFDDTPDPAILSVYNKFYDFVIECVLYALQNDQRAIDFTES